MTDSQYTSNDCYRPDWWDSYVEKSLKEKAKRLHKDESPLSKLKVLLMKER